MIVQTGGYTRSQVNSQRGYIALDCDRCNERVNMLRVYWKPTRQERCPVKKCGGTLLASGQWSKPRTLTANPAITKPNPPKESNNNPKVAFIPQPFIFTTYPEYLASDLWQHIRGAIYRRDKGICRVCHRKGSQVHHLSYDTAVLEGRRLDQLVLVCRDCHQRLEFDKHGNKRSTNDAAKEFFRLIAKPQPKHKPRQHKHRRLKRHSGKDPFAKTHQPRHAILGKERGGNR